MVPAVRAVREFVHFPRVRRLPAVPVDRPDIAHRPAREGFAEVLVMEPVEGRSEAPTKRAMTAGQPMISRRAAIGGGLAGLGGLLLFPGQLLAKAAVPSNSFVVPLKGPY